ncbi:MAG: UDP-N-acetylglucosamine 2-epimerase (non-hydrolyzing) [Verrucomicrobia bacterium]|nr:UDP-N-acetylglucosamine 2-epimerase (non-hydrolyzing) [Verrucomicrobiota bacterium]
MKIINVVGARPNFVKIAPILEAYKAFPRIIPLLVHTGQHYDPTMSDLFFRQLGIPEPDLNLDVGSGSHATQTADIMKTFEPVVLKQRPDAVLVVGDVNSTIACGLVAAKMGVKLIHVEAGLRSFDRTMPEEINRVLTDALADLLFCTEQSGVDNLLREGVAREKIHLVGNVMIDSLLRHRAHAAQSEILDQLGLEPRRYAVLTLHRPSNVDDPVMLGRLFEAFEIIQRDLPIVFPVHPRARPSLMKALPSDVGRRLPRLKMTGPLGYLDFLKLMDNARLVLTDSGGIQEETTILGVPCLTLRDNTERPATVEFGTNHVVGRNPDAILSAYHRLQPSAPLEQRTSPLWDGHAAERIAERINAMA